jgi:hypothetical protein
MKYPLIILLFLTCLISQAQERSYIKNNSFYGSIPGGNGDTTFLDPIPLYFPAINYLDYSSDILNAHMLSCYSKTLTYLKEPILFDKNQEFARFVILEEGRSTSYRLQKNGNNYFLIKSFMNGNYENPTEIAIDTVKLDSKVYIELWLEICKLKVWNIKPHSIDYYAYDESHIMLFESTFKGGYHFTDFHFTFTFKDPLFKDYYKLIEKIKKTISNKT